MTTTLHFWAVSRPKYITADFSQWPHKVLQGKIKKKGGKGKHFIQGPLMRKSKTFWSIRWVSNHIKMIVCHL